MTFHQITIVGNLGKDPELRYLPSGDAVGNLSVAVSDGYKDKASGQWKDRTIWFRVSVFGKNAENAHQYLAKGRKVLVAGSLKADDSGNPAVFTRKDGSAGASFEVNAHTLRFLDRAPAPDDDDDVIAATPAKGKIPF